MYNNCVIIKGVYEMNVRSVGLQNTASKINFAQNEENKTEKQDAPKYENPISRKKEKSLAVLSVIGGSAVVGAIAAGLDTCLKLSKKTSGIIGAGIAVLTAALTLPSKLYNTAVNAFAREKEMDVFSRDKELKSSLTEEVHKEVLDPNVSLDKKLDDNLKLQMSNRANGLFIQH